jgi:hypothetical protein
MLVSIGDIGQFAWGTAGVLCSSPQCSGGNLVADNAVNFSAYPARNACKTLGGRLPTITELDCIYANMASYSTYSVFLSNDYLSATEIDAIYAWHKPF